MPRRKAAPRPSNDLDLRLVVGEVAVVARPRELQRAALGGHGGESDERIRRDGLTQLRPEDFDAIKAADELGDDVARYELARLGAAKAGLHDVLREGLDLDDLAALGARRDGDRDARHQMRPSSRQAESVTTTDTV